MNFEQWFSARFPTIPLRSALAVLRLSEEGATLPFIARYRKEQTGNLDEVAIADVLESKETWDELLKRQAFVLAEIESQGKLTPELKARISATFDPTLLEDLYLPYKQKKKSKATMAMEAGLGELADWVWDCGHGTQKPHTGQTLDIWALTYRNEAKGLPDLAAVLDGVEAILVARLADDPELRQPVRDALMKKGILRSEKSDKAKANSKFEPYFNFSESIPSLMDPKNSHRYLALRRGWKEEELVHHIGGPAEDTSFDEGLRALFEQKACTVPDSPGSALLSKCAGLAYKSHVLPSMEAEIHRTLKASADKAAILVFAENVRKVLLSSPFGAKSVLGVDPGVRTGCKVVMIDASGKYLGNTVLHIESDEQKNAARETLKQILTTFPPDAIAVGNGTGGREAEVFLRATVKEMNKTIPVVMVSESGASIYSASDTAREEFPELDVTVRGAISIARRFQDPLAELVKIDPKSIGVGQYQYDVNQSALRKSLDTVVDVCVNSVGVNLNTASYHLLSRISGIGEALAKAIVTRRGEKGLFKSRQDLLEVPRFSQKSFEQSAGFLRIPEAENVLDNTGVHPERYSLLEALCERLGKKVSDLLGTGVELVRKDEKLKSEVGPFTFEDIVRDLEKPGRDPRAVFVPFAYREDIFELKDCKPGLVCPGRVTNVTNFGAFVDIGVHQDGLVHISQLCDRFVKDPNEVVSPGDRVTVRILEVNLEKKQLSLSMKAAVEARPAPRREMPARGAQGGGRPPQHKKGSAPRPPRNSFANRPFADALASLKKQGR